MEKKKKFRVVVEYEVFGDPTWSDEQFMSVMKQHLMENEICKDFYYNEGRPKIVVVLR